MKLNFAATNADVRGGGFRTGFNLVKVQDINHSHKPDAQRNISPLVLKCSSIQQAKMKLKSAQEGRQRLSPEILRKTKEDLFSQTDRPWPFKETPPNSVEETRPNFSELIKPNALAPLIKSNLENLRTLQEESTIVEEQDKTFLPMRTSPRETEANEEKDSLKKRASSQPLVGPLHTILPKDLARTGAMRRLINQSIVKTRRETTKFNKTVQGFLGSQPKNFNSDRNLHTSQADLMRTKSQLGSLLTNHKVAQKKEENGAYPQINHTSYQHHKFQRTLQRSFITNMPPKKSLVYIFHNKKDTIEKTIQDLQIKRLHFKDDFVDSEMLEMKVKGMRRSRSVQGFRKSLELAKIQQVENSSQKILAEEKKKQLRKDGNEHKSASQKTLKTQAGDETALLDPQGGLPIITGESNKIAMISDSEYFRKTYIKEFKIGPDGKYNGNNPSLKNKILKQEFAYYSELTQRMLDDLSSNLQEAALGGYSYEEYKVLKSNFKEGIMMKVFIEACDLLKKIKPFIAKRILLALGINPHNQFEMVTWSHFLTFKKLLVYRDAQNCDIVDFIIKFFRLDEKELVPKEEFLRLLRIVTSKNEEKTAEENPIYEKYITHFGMAGIIRDDTKFVDFNKFKFIFNTFKMDIMELLDLIINN